MRLSRSLRRAVAASALAALAVPVAASAHPGVYTVMQKVAPDGCTYPNLGCFGTDRMQYAVGNDGYALSFTEDNGLETGGGMINYKAMPSGWRAPMTPDQKRTFANAQTPLQAHATCSGTALDSGANILAWQSADPFFNYIPWQSTSAGLGDDPAKWIPVVKNATGVDLSKLSGDAAFKSACESAPVNGTYHKADTPASITTAMLADAVGPLQSQVSQLQNQVTTLQAAKAASDKAAAASEAARVASVNRPLALTLSGKRFAQPIAMVTGAAGTAVTVKVLLSSANAKTLKLSRTIATKKKTLGAPGAELLTLSLTTKAGKAIKKHGHALKVTVEAAGGGKTVTRSGTLNGA